jgi:hypothetical protein
MIYVFWYKIICLLTGLAIIYLGYLLFIKGIFNESGDVKGRYQDYRLSISKAAPGTYFVLFGSLVITLTTFKGFSTDEMLSKGLQTTHGKENTIAADTTLTIKDSLRLK